MKPAWAQMGKDLNITWNDMAIGDKISTSNNLGQLIATKDEQGNTLYSKVDIFTSDLSKVVEEAVKGTSILNLADYLDNMPNFHAFLQNNPVVYLSLLQDGMNTNNGSGKKVYVAPYFDGNDDIERYCIVRHDWAKKLLNGDTAPTGSTAYASDVKVQSYMQTTGKLEIESLSADGSATQTITKNYDEALKAAKDETKPLGSAYKTIAGAVYSGESGNIVDIMNAAITANKANATGANLVALFRAYIDVCYGSAYTPATRANLFCGYDACWDVDDLVAMLRCIVANKAYLGVEYDKFGGIAVRDGTNDRTPDLVRLGAQLYGARGADSRLENTYIAKDGTLKDARADKELYEAMAKMNLLMQEGLIADFSGISSFAAEGGLGINKNNPKEPACEYFMLYDYAQTQTLNGFYNEDAQVTGVTIPEEYYMSPIITPISKWDVDGDGNHTDIMRFTESWRSTKTSGLAVNGSVASDENKLKAVLQFVDYLYSEDGQIVSTYGPMASNADGKDGFWYNTQATDAQVTAGSYFTYKGVKYSGSDYKGKTTPTITQNLFKSFKGLEVNGFKVTDNKNISGGKLNFTNYARQIIGSTLPVGVKDQSFEYQLTSQIGKDGTYKVGVALAKGVIKGMTLQLNKDNYWYTCVPTGLPVSSVDQKEILGAADYKEFTYLTGAKRGDSKNFYSIFAGIVLNGTSHAYNQQEVALTYTSINNLLNEAQLQGKTVSTYAKSAQIVYGDAWKKALSYWTYIQSETSK